jgi:hypothetical protein
MVTARQVNDKKAQLENELASISKDIICRFPVSNYLNTARSNTGFGRLLHFQQARKLSRSFRQITDRYGSRALSLYLKLALCYFIGDSLERLSEENLPDEIVLFYHEWFKMVLDEFSTQPDDHYDCRSLSFTMDVMACSLRDIPVGGAWILETRRAGLRPFWGGGIRQFFDYLQFLILKCGGFRSYFTTHTVPRYLSRFNEREMNLAYQRIAELMKLNPRIRGIYRRSWFLDPHLQEISPKLAYLRQVPLQNGAKLFAACPTKLDTKYALAVSPTRRRLHAEGKYLPTGYALVWPRKEFLAWANRCSSAPTEDP